MSVRLMRAFYSRLSADTGGSTNDLRTAVNDRIFAMEAPASSALPLVIYNFMGIDTSNDFDGNTMTQATVEVSIFQKTEAGVDALASIEEKAYNLLNDQNVSATGFDRAYIRSVARGTPLIEGEYMRSDSTFIIEGTDLVS